MSTSKAKKLPIGSKLSLVETEGLSAGAYHLYDLRGLSAGKVQLLIDLLTQAKADHNPLATDILAIMTTNITPPVVEHRFRTAVATAESEGQKLKLKAIEYLLFDPIGKDVAKAAEQLAEIGF